MKFKKVPRRKANIIINSLQGGVVPRVGLGYISVGRSAEIDALLKDVEIINDGGSTFRVISGKYGSGKTFLIQTFKEHLLEKGFVVMDCDLSPERLFVGSGSKMRGLATYKKLLSNTAIKTNSEGGALQTILDNLIAKIYVDIVSNTPSIGGYELINKARKEFKNYLSPVLNMVHGIDFTNILLSYFDAYQSEDYDKKIKLLKWLRGEYRLKSEVKKELGVSDMISDQDWFDYIEIYSVFFQSIGYTGLYLMFDEVVNIYRIVNSAYRLKNFEKILGMYNDTLQGKISKLGIVLAGTPESIYDPEKGLFSYDALKSRLYFNKYSLNKNNLLAPVIDITQLTQSDIIILLKRLAEIHASVHNYTNNISTDLIIDFLNDVYQQSNVVITTRSIIRDYLNLLDVFMQNESLTFSEIMKSFVASSDIERSQKEIV